nr:hypothetical protein [uncultured Rhodoferax sp.]
MQTPQTPTKAKESSALPGRSVLAWPAWLRVAALLPALVLLWLAVWWASVEALPL